MANAYSTIRRYNQPQSSVQGELISTVLATKQGKFDVNMSQVNEALQQVSSIDLIRDRDKVKLYENLKGLITTLDNTDDLDFSTGGLGSEIATYVSKALDSDILTQAGNTIAIRNYQGQVNEIKNKKPDLYAQQNDWFATSQAGLTQYLQGDTDNLGNLNYTPYTDYNKEIDDNLFKWAKEFGFTPFYEKSTSEDGISFMKEGEKLSRVDVKNFLRSKLDGKYRNQIFIDTAYNFKDSSTEALSDKYKTYHTDKVDEVIAEEYATILDLKQQGYSDKDIEQVRNSFSERKAFHESESKRQDINRNTALQYLGEESFLDTKAATYAKTKYTKVSPDNADIKRAELQLKKAKEKAESLGASVGSDVGGVMSLTPTPTDGTGTEIGALQESTLGLYATERQGLLTELLGKDELFRSAYNAVSTEEEKSNIFEKKIKDLTTVVIGGDVDPDLRKKAFSYLSSAKNLSTINKAYSEVIEQKADKFYNSLYQEINSENPDINLINFKDNFPKTVELVTNKGLNLTPEDKEVIKYEFANGLKDVRGLSNNGKNAVEDYINSQYNKVSKIQGVENPEKSSNIANVFSNLGADISDAFTALGSGFDEEILKEIEQKRERKPVSPSGVASEIGDFFGGIGEAVTFQNLLRSDRNLDELDPEDLQYQDSKGNFIEISDDIKAAFQTVEAAVDEKLQGSERRLPQSFELVLDPVTAKYRPEIRREVAAVYAQRTNKNPKDKDRLTLSVNKKDGSAIIRNISDNEDLSGITQVRIEELPEPLLSKIETRESEWQYDASNPSAVPVSVNYSVPSGEGAREKSLKHIYNLKNKYGVNLGNNIELARKSFAPTDKELFSALKTTYPNANEQQIVELLSANYNIKYTPDPSTNVYNYELYKNGNLVYSGNTTMNVFNEGLVAYNNQTYINRYLEAELAE